MSSTSKYRSEKYHPYAFTEQGVAMLASVLRSEIAIEANIHIVRAFIALRQSALCYVELKRQLEDFMVGTNTQFSEVYQVLTQLTEQKKLENKPRNPIGFR